MTNGIRAPPIRVLIGLQIEIERSLKLAKGEQNMITRKYNTIIYTAKIVVNNGEQIRTLKYELRDTAVNRKYPERGIKKLLCPGEAMIFVDKEHFEEKCVMYGMEDDKFLLYAVPCDPKTRKPYGDLTAQLTENNTENE